eukprot:8127240-Alexandrium_andersonii.AAC.1
MSMLARSPSRERSLRFRRVAEAPPSTTAPSLKVGSVWSTELPFNGLSAWVAPEPIQERDHDLSPESLTHALHEATLFS